MCLFSTGDCEILIDRIENAIAIFKKSFIGNNFVIVGGVAANFYIKEKIESYLATHDIVLAVPPNNLCTETLL